MVIARARGETFTDVSLWVVPLAGNSLENWYTIRYLNFRGVSYRVIEKKYLIPAVLTFLFISHKLRNSHHNTDYGG